ncbi:MAG TPA: ABC transporter permease [Mycobacteriales bacterium]|jgi:simple sugar transport system permease protein|nr:ABC transporter permease [Mycobacteriales bacterium]
MTARRESLRRIALTMGAAGIALVVSLLVSTVVLLLSDADPVEVFTEVVEYGQKPAQLVNMLNKGTGYYLSAIAVAIGFRMALFNIGVDGQYRLAAMLAAALGAAVSLPAPLHVLMIVVVAMAVGALWAGIAALLKVTRGVSEVISTIMLNAIAGSIVAYLLHPDRLAVSVAGSNNIGTEPLPASARVPGLRLAGTESRVFGMVIVAMLVGVGYWVLLNRTRFGFDLRATGQSPTAAIASGVDVRRMVVTTMLLSGAVAGLVGLPQLLGASYTYGLDFPAGIGFTGIAIALLGRNHPVGIALGALLWAFLEEASQILDLLEVSPEIVRIIQGTVVLSVVVVYELVRRYTISQQQRSVGEQLAAEEPAVEGARA